MLNIEILNKLYFWVVAPLDNNINIHEIKDYILKNFGKLPMQITEYNEDIKYSFDSFIEDMFGYLDYSNKYIFALLNGGRKYLLKILKYLYYLLIPLFILPFFLVRFFNFLNNLYLYIITGFFLLTSIILFSIDKISDKILKMMKPGDILKILDAPDENFPVTRIEPSFGPNKYESVTIVESKKKFICKHYRELINIKNTKNLYKLMVYYFATQYLIDIENNDEIILDYRNQINEVLEYILAFKRESKYLLFNLAHNELNMLLINKSLKHFLDYQNICKNNLNVNAWIIVLKFINEL
jgi:hypothetical protein